MKIANGLNENMQRQALRTSSDQCYFVSGIQTQFGLKRVHSWEIPQHY